MAQIKSRSNTPVAAPSTSRETATVHFSRATTTTPRPYSSLSSPPVHAPDQPDAPDHPPLPPAQLFDILPPLYTLLARLEPTLNPIQPVAGADGVLDSLGLVDPLGTSQGQLGETGLKYKDAAVEAGFLKARMRKCLAELAGLGDMHRTVEEQGTEIAELEKRIDRQRNVLRVLGDRAGAILDGEELR